MAQKRLPLHKTLSQGKKGFVPMTLQVMSRYSYVVNPCKKKKKRQTQLPVSPMQVFHTLSISEQKVKN